MLENDTILSGNRIELFQEILEKEYLIRNEWQFIFFNKQDPRYIFSNVVQLFEIVNLSTVPRSYLKNYNLCTDEQVFESVGAHTNLVHAIFSRAMANFEYYFKSLEDESNVEGVISEEINRYTRDEIHEAIMLHDLPENEIGDWPDNTSYNLGYKHRVELEYFKRYVEHSTYSDPDFKIHVLELLENMHPEGSLTGQLLYLADKTAAIIAALAYDIKNLSPKMRIGQSIASARDRLEMARCDYRKKGYCKASEMWTMDFFEMRQISRCDHTGFFTALIIMATLVVNNTWYTWRKRTYNEYFRVTEDIEEDDRNIETDKASTIIPLPKLGYEEAK